MTLKYQNCKNSDSRIHTVPLETILENFDYFVVFKDNDIFSEKRMPLENKVYYKITNELFIVIIYGFNKRISKYDGELKYVEVALRDGEKEYLLFNKKILELKNKKHKSAKDKEYLLKIIKIFEKIPKFKNTSDNKLKISFEDSLIKIDYFEKDSIENKYVVLDVETNGLKKKSDDLLSICIYDPFRGIAYLRFLPLDLQPVVFTGWINGLTSKKINKYPHLTQEELDEIINYFDLNHKTILTYSGGKGTFDLDFIKNYLYRRNLKGFDNYEFVNIKQYFPPAPYGCEGQMTKDNLCKLFGIEGVTKIHSSLNDTLLEWKLFKKIYKKNCIITNYDLYYVHKDYVIPITYLNRNQNLVKYLDLNIPQIDTSIEKIYEYHFNKKTLKEVKKFDTNITGITIENAINSYFNVNKQDNSAFLINNKKKLEYIGSFVRKNIIEIPIQELSDGTIKSLDSKYDSYVEKVNDVTKTILSELKPSFDYIKENVFNASDEIMSQELSISNNGKILAKCDLSTRSEVLEIKTTQSYKKSLDYLHLSDNFARQLYYEANGRKAFILFINFDLNINSKTYEKIINDLVLCLFKVNFKVNKEIKSYEVLSNESKLILKEIIKDNSISFPLACLRAKVSKYDIKIYMKELKEKGYIVWEGENSSHGFWKVLRNID